jgi:hypothetical protein
MTIRKNSADAASHDGKAVSRRPAATIFFVSECIGRP